METTSTTTPAERPASQLPTALLAAAFVVVAAIFLASTTWYLVFKTIHIAFSVIWVGGGLMITILAFRAERSDDPGELLTVSRQAAAVAERIFMPSSLIVLVMGIAMMATDTGSVWSWSSFWLVAGLIGFASTFVVGVGVLTPQVKRLQTLTESVGPTAPETLAAIRRILLIARFDIAVLLLVVLDMAAKPFLS